MHMTKTRLLQAVCTVAMLAAAPAFAQQTETPTGATGPNGSANPQATQSMSGNNGGSGGMTPANPGGTGASASADSHATHRSGMGRAMHGGRDDNSQNAAVDRLNDQSYQAAQQGQS